MYTVNVTLEGRPLQVRLSSSPLTITDLQRAVVGTVCHGELTLPRGSNGHSLAISFSYRDLNGREVALRRDCELARAERVSLGTLHLTATLQVASLQQRNDPAGYVGPTAREEDRLYQVATFKLRTRGVPSIKTMDLKRTMALVGLCPRRLVLQGLAAPRVMKGENPILACQPGDCGADGLACSSHASQSSAEEGWDSDGQRESVAAMAQVRPYLT